ncbi:hypothetical protein HMN09_00843400 [Mycena chlorophos]|uniref:F-box domain-containing protein n=1 Tax=Mycena chlorophos TaxID=658473 RepID=A0A8H6W7E0_MYCCL|nr:hypothetical protein HMN09_00843400 [Mycena chlorophos]
MSTTGAGASGAALLVDLLDELLVLIILHLPLRDIGALLLLGNHRLTSLIRSSIEIQYLLEQQLSGVEENASLLRVTEGLSIADRLAELRLREKRWLEFNPSARRQIQAPPSTVEYYLEGDICIAADRAVHNGAGAPEHPTCLQTIHLSNAESVRESGWTPVYRPAKDKRIISYVLASAQDLMCVVTSDVSPGVNGAFPVQIELLTISGQPHPLAKSPTIDLCTHGHEGAPTIIMEIVGARIGACVSHGNKYHLYLFDWLKNVSCMKDPIKMRSRGFALLSEDAVLCWVFGNSLDIIFIRPRYGEVRLLFPPFLRNSPGRDNVIHSVTFSSFPPPDERGHAHPSPGARFRPSPERVIGVNFYTDSSPTSAKLIINSKGFLEFARGQLRPPNMAAWSWEFWGPRFTRFVRGHEFHGDLFGASSFGWRLASIPTDAVAHPAPITVLDFSPYRIRRLGPAIASGKHAQSEHAEIKLSPPPRPLPKSGDADGDGDHEVDPAYADLEGQGLDSEVPCIRVVSKELFDYDYLHMSNECIVGVKWSGDFVDKFELLYFV